MLKNRFTKRIAATGLAASLALTSVAAVNAQEEQPEDDPKQGYIGIVAGYDGSSLVLEATQPESAEVTLEVNDDTVIKTPGGPDIAGTLEQGANVAVLGIEEDDGTWTALQILVKPTAPMTEATSGAVVSKEGNVLTIQLPNGETKELQLGQDEDGPEVGDVVTAFSRRGGEGGRPEVTGLQRADEVRERLQQHLDDVADNAAELPEAVAAARDRVAERLSDVIERHTQRHQEMLERTLENPNIPEAARERIEEARDRARANVQDVIDRLEEIRDRLDLPERGPNARPTGTPNG